MHNENPVRVKVERKTMEKCKLIFSEELNPIEKNCTFWNNKDTMYARGK